jgi:hypothetical protein
MPNEDDLIANVLEDAIRGYLLEASRNGELTEVASVHAYHEVGIETSDAGLVVRLENGMEFQIAIKRSL